MPVTVMIVDDSKLARIVAARALAELQPDWERVDAASAAQAVELIKLHRVDVAMIDFNMAEKNGLQLAKELRASHPDLPIAITTANVQDGIIAEARAIGAAFIPKPINTDGLRGFVSGVAILLKSRSARHDRNIIQ